jgi:hypothetical protein
LVPLIMASRPATQPFSSLPSEVFAQRPALHTLLALIGLAARDFHQEPFNLRKKAGLLNHTPYRT